MTPSERSFKVNDKRHIAPKKSLGQNFLTDKNIIAKTVAELNAEPGDLIVEIGPGEGALTERLLEKSRKLLAVELDERACELLRHKFAAADNFNLIRQDFLKFDFREGLTGIGESGNKVKLLGNIPYYISGRIFFKIFSDFRHIERAVITVQKEVAERIVARPSSKQYGILSVLARHVAEPSIAFDVSPGCFFPKPKVNSAVVVLDFKSEIDEDIDFKKLATLVKTAFGQRRKKVANTVKNILTQSNINIDKSPERFRNLLALRAENLSRDDFVYLYRYIYESE